MAAAMILYTTVGYSDYERAVRFYDAVFAVLGQPRCADWGKGFAGWGASHDEGASFWICPPFNGKAPAPGNGTMFGFRAKDERQVQAFHAAALANGGSDEGAPGTRPYYDPDFYVAYVRDPDGNKLSCFYHRHRP
jgi:catechol 2,3-dioxygenase-like lactoylglutathione lyase family enzyme